MIVYNSTIEKFSSDVDTGNIENIILNLLEKRGQSAAQNEIRSWRNSLSEMDRLLVKTDIPDDTGVSIEYKIPQTSKRIDFILTGQDINKKDTALIIELKQWESARLSNKDGIIETILNKGYRETSHPSYQVWSYATLMADFNSTVEDMKISLIPCAYLHNYKEDDVIRDDNYKKYLEKAPIFLRNEQQELRQFIEDNIKYGDKNNLIWKIDNGKIRPSRGLIERVSHLMEGKDEFVMIDDQKIIFERGIELAKLSNSKNKNVFIIEGGPGTGKSIVAINFLVNLLKKENVVAYVSKNAAPRDVYHSKLTGLYTQTTLSSLFKGSGVFHNIKSNIWDVLVVDEAHRLNEKSGFFQNKGENQIKEIINASKMAIFFIDENQKVTLKDIGEIDTIKKFAKELNATVNTAELSSQFRCDGSDGYLAFLDDVLQIKETANDILDIDYDFQVFDTPSELRDVIFEKNKLNNKARLVAGYCWDWISRKDNTKDDIVFPEFNFSMKWNLTEDGTRWIISPNSVNEVGCIHTSQGLEVDYIGVIVGEDLIIRDGNVLVNPQKRAKSDASLKGYQKLLEVDKEKAQKTVRTIIKNTYRTLMSRGMKGCYIYCVDKETNEYFKSIINNL